METDAHRLYLHDRFFARFIEPMIPASLRPNHVTVFRMLLTPIVLWFLYAENYKIGVPLFLFAALTDAFDGSLARVRNQITPWGIMYDPLADKLLIGSVLFLIVLEHVNLYLGFSLFAVEVVIILGAWLQWRRGKINAANFWGKAKMVAEVVGITFLLVALWFDVNLLVDVSTGTLAVALIVAIVSIFSRSS